MTNKRILDLIEQYMTANAAHNWDKAREIFEELKGEERREEERAAKEKRERRDA